MKIIIIIIRASPTTIPYLFKNRVYVSTPLNSVTPYSSSKPHISI